MFGLSRLTTNYGGKKRISNRSTTSAMTLKEQERRTSGLDITLQPCDCSAPCSPNCSRWYLSQDSDRQLTKPDAGRRRGGSVKKLLALAAVFGFILYGNTQNKSEAPRPRMHARQGMMTENIPDSDNSDNIEDLRGGGDQRATATAPSSKWYPQTGGNSDHTLPLDFSVHNPPWQYWRSQDPPQAVYEAPNPAIIEPERPQHHRPRPAYCDKGWCLKTFCPPERNSCWYPQN